MDNNKPSEADLLAALKPQVQNPWHVGFDMPHTGSIWKDAVTRALQLAPMGLRAGGATTGGPASGSISPMRIKDFNQTPWIKNAMDDYTWASKAEFPFKSDDVSNPANDAYAPGTTSPVDYGDMKNWSDSSKYHWALYEQNMDKALKDLPPSRGLQDTIDQLAGNPVYPATGNELTNMNPSIKSAKYPTKNPTYSQFFLSLLGKDMNENAP